MYQLVNQKRNDQNKTPAILKASCFAGYIFVGIAILMGLLFIVISESPNTFRLFPEINFYVSLANGKISVNFALLSLLLPVIAFFGLVQLWYQLKIGFWLFTVPKLLLIALIFFYIDLPLIDIWYITQPLLIIAVILIMLFGLNYKKMY